jgi:hypothetical protein
MGDRGVTFSILPQKVTCCSNPHQLAKQRGKARSRVRLTHPYLRTQPAFRSSRLAWAAERSGTLAEEIAKVGEAVGHILL